MFVQSMKFIQEHQGDTKKISVFGQEKISTTLKLAKMNLAIRGISANMGTKATSTFQNDQHPDLKADYALMNPPFNQKDWREENELTDDARWKGYAVPPTGNANYAWILNFISKLSNEGIGCLLLANGALSSSGSEYEIRKQLIDNDLVESIIILPMNMFYTTDISVTVWIFNKNKKYKKIKKNNEEFENRDRSNEILFMDLRKKGHPFEKKYIYFNEKDINEFASIYHLWKRNNSNYKNIKELCYSATKSEVVNKDYSLVPSKYIEVEQNNINDYSEKLEQLKEELISLYKEDELSKQKLFEEINNG